MRHGDKVNNLGRKKAHREALLSNLASQLITHKRIVTTLAKAKALRTYVEPLITKTKKGTTREGIMHHHRIVFSYLQNKIAVKELFTVVAPKVADRPGGYTRIIKLGTRPGDNAEKALIELVDFNEIYNVDTTKSEASTKKTRRGRSGKKSTASVSLSPEDSTNPGTEERSEIVDEGSFEETSNEDSESTQAPDAFVDLESFQTAAASDLSTETFYSKEEEQTNSNIETSSTETTIPVLDGPVDFEPLNFDPLPTGSSVEEPKTEVDEKKVEPNEPESAQ